MVELNPNILVRDDIRMVAFFRQVLQKRDKVREEDQKEEKRRREGAGEGEEQ